MTLYTAQSPDAVAEAEARVDAAREASYSARAAFYAARAACSDVAPTFLANPMDATARAAYIRASSDVHAAANAAIAASREFCYAKEDARVAQCLARIDASRARAVASRARCDAIMREAARFNTAVCAFAGVSFVAIIAAVFFDPGRG